MLIHQFEPAQFPSPLTQTHHDHQRHHIKHLGISPDIQRGICGFRVIWRPFLKRPIPYVDEAGRHRLKAKSDHVRTAWFAIAAGVDEAQAFQEANHCAARAYRTKAVVNAPIVAWEHLANIKGVKIRDSYAKPALNGDMHRAAALFALGHSPREVGRRLGVDRSTASRWRKALGMDNKKAPKKT